MRIVDRFSFARGAEVLARHHAAELAQVEAAIAAIDGESCRVKRTNERGRSGLLYSPIAINYCLLEKQLYLDGWDSAERKLTLRERFPATGYDRRIPMSMDGIKNRVGLESQFGKYAFLEYDVLAKMPIYEQRGLIDVGVEIAPVSRLRSEMSSGIGDFERVVTNLIHRGERSSDFPVLILGINVDTPGTVRPISIAYEGEVGPNLRGNRPGPSA